MLLQNGLRLRLQNTNDVDHVDIELVCSRFVVGQVTFVRLGG